MGLPGFSTLSKHLRCAGLAMCLCAWAGGAQALALGELRTQSRLGDKLLAEIELTGEEESQVDAGCVRVGKPADDTMPWLDQVSYSLRRGTKTFIVLRSVKPVSDPVLRVSVHLGCGYDLNREYTVYLASSTPEVDLPSARVNQPVRSATVPVAPVVYAPLPAVKAPSTTAERSNVSVRPPAPRKTPGGDRLVLMGGGNVQVPEPALALSYELSGITANGDVSQQAVLREQLRLEYRMLQALHQQALTLLETAEKLRQMEQTLNELHARVAGAPAPAALPPVETASPLTETSTVVAEVPTTTIAPAPDPIPPKTSPKLRNVSENGGNWWLYVLVVVLFAALGFWLWRARQQRIERMLASSRAGLLPLPASAHEAQAAESGFGGEAHPGDVQVHHHVDFDLTEAPPDALEPSLIPAAGEDAAQGGGLPAANIEDQFEVNPVMELADIMLSFGRVKGAAQALQEFIDHNPEEALQPWIRLMDVYRMAGMREEFERVSANLNQYFNVEIQQWSDHSQAADTNGNAAGAREEPLPIQWPTSAKKAKSVEEMPHIKERLETLWYGQEAIEYVEGLLRDNRGGLRTGFTIEVADELVFLLELLQTLVKMDAEASAEEKK